MDRCATISLLVNNPTRSGRIAQATVRRYPIERSDCANPFAIPHLVEPEILRILQERDIRLPEKRQNTVSGPIRVLNPPSIPRRALNQSIPLRFVQHRKVLQFRIGLKHAPGDLKQPEILSIPYPAIIFPLKIIASRGGPRRNT